MNYLSILENNTLEYINAHFSCGFLNFLMPLLSLLDEHGEVWILTAVVLMCIPKYREHGARLAIALLVGYVICNLILKPCIARIRPFETNEAVRLIIARPTDFSFPSGHTVSSFASVPVIWKANKKFGIAALVLAILIAFSRLYLYVHYPSDIAAGVILGLTIGFFVSRIRLKKTETPD